MAIRLGRDPRVLALAGPTAAGKSVLAAELAAAVGGAVVSADSRQVYRGLEIGTAQPGAALRARAAHFLVGFLSPAARYSAGDYGTDARRVAAALLARGVPVVLCGGTGLYLRAALDGVPADEGGELEGGGLGSAPGARAAAAATRRSRRAELERRWAVEGGAALHAELGRVDPALAARLHPRDRQRVLRGLEFHGEHGRPLSTSWRPGAAPADAESTALRFRLELPPRELDRRIGERLAAMVRAGLLEEARALFERYGGDPPLSLSAVGYPELFAHLRGEVFLDEALETIRLRSRQYAKRQLTWFRNQDGYRPLPAGEAALPLLLAAWRERLP